MSTASMSTPVQQPQESTPALSVLTPSYGYARYIEDTIASVKAQSLGSAVEHVVADGASTDGTVRVLQAHPGIRWISEPDRGQSDALNAALAMSKAPVLGWLNADEFYLPGALARALHEFNDPSVDVVYGDALFVDADGRFIRRLGQHRFSKLVLRHYGPFIPTCSLFLRRSALREDEPWDVDFRRVMDWDLYLSLARRGATFRYVPYTFGAFRVHDERVTAQPIDEPVRAEHARVRQRHSIPDPNERRGRARVEYARLSHRLLKLREGSYVREARARSLRGEDLRWWRGEAAGTSLAALGVLTDGGDA